MYALQALRGMAAILVVLCHSIITAIDKFGSDPNPKQFGFLLGGIGVRVFFLISGFVMIYSHENDFGQPGAQRSFTKKTSHSNLATLLDYYTYLLR
jgi:exopolysaccharide production protein ExoZ